MKDGKDDEVLRAAFKDAATVLVAEGAEVITHAELVFCVLRQAMDTLRRMPDREAAWLYGQRGFWPEIVHNYAERFAAYEQEVNALLSGEVRGDSQRKIAATPQAIQRMHVVFDLFPYLIVGSKRRRDYRVLCGLAGGTSATKLAKECRFSVNSVWDRKVIQTAAIAKKLEKFMPEDDEIAALQGSLEVDRVLRQERLERAGLSG
jgi:hypothetical protein